MTQRWITSDTHLAHRNILTYCPWRQTWAASIEEHDRKLIEAWNAVVNPGDTVYHVGDFALTNRAAIAELRAQLNGVIVLVRGNHDRSTTQMISAGFAVREFVDLLVDGVPIVMRHRPTDFVAAEWTGYAALLHGHWHGEDHRATSPVPPEYWYKLVDVGIDARHEIAPANLSALVRGVLALRP